MPIRFLLVDALNLIRRVYAAHPGEDGPERVSGALTSTMGSLNRALRECGPTHAVIVFEGEGPGWRHQRYPAYKAGRAPMPEPLRSGLPRFEREFFEKGIQSLRFPGVEADDVIATLAGKVALRGGHAVILSTDRTFLQLLSDRVRVRDHFRQRDLDRAFVAEKYGVEPGEFADFLALCGEPTNNVKGVPGIGAKTAAGLLKEFGTLERILSAAGTLPGRPGEALRRHAEDVLLARTMVTLRTDLELGLNLKSFRLRQNLVEMR
jgi:5'-3' exonuclease